MRTMVLLASAMLMAGTVDAQATAQGRSRTVERDARRAEEAAAALREGVMERFMVADSALLNRATIGVSLGGAAHKRDTLGVFVEAVAEDGPAERAGIFEGHRIAYINGIDVRASAADAGDPYLSSVGRHRLIRAMRDVTPGGTVTLRVWTGSGYRDVQVTASRYADVYKSRRFGATWIGTPGAGFGPEGMEFHRMEVPTLRYLEVRPTEGTRAPLRRLNVRPANPRGAAPTRARRAIVAPSLEATPRALTAPRIVVPAQGGLRRYTI